MASGGKTPVAFLQELGMKTHTTPEYNLIQNELGSNNVRTFIYELVVDEHRVEGSGNSKKLAKHSVAYNMLQLLMSDPKFADCGIARFLNVLEKTNQCPALEVVSIVNDVGHLDDFCTDYNVPGGEYNCVLEEGPAHFKWFTMACTTFNVTKKAAANVKQQAKHAAASVMYGWLNGLVTYEATRRCSVDDLVLPQSSSSDGDSSSQFLEVSATFSPKKPNMSLFLDDMKNALYTSDVCSPTLALYLTSYKEDNFLVDHHQSVLDIFRTIVDECHFNYRIKNMGKVHDNFVVVVTLLTVPEFTAIGYAKGLNEAVNAAALDAIKIMCMSYGPSRDVDI